ncbi:hypothetical protein ACQQ2N_12295 [Dokdonella sp. MW10]|uniref:hypothetical protein n=1 Tax=Dokdonella sp. MW10 TaxID=2992926 RepID=UPI003F815EE4
MILTLALLLTGIDVPAQDVTDEIRVEAVGTTCIALVVFAEARGRSWLEQGLVARAIVNRQAELGDGADACDVVLEQGYSEALDAWPYPRSPWDLDERSWQRALDVARVIVDDDYDLPRDCAAMTHFTSAPAGSLPSAFHACTVGALTFYRPALAVAGAAP